ncbi:dCTP pyrophosphatase 1 [Trichoplax sp. H2]|nr:dCTP pyrophosphatase 1 [Trichoplax sp. H2]|eukprot:RDD42883.1 dCTP pyrophosphatase 1 [Trichoplax sp. H2]
MEMDNNVEQEKFQFTQNISLENIRAIQKKFIEERNWDQFHSPRNVLLALTGEVGELAEIFQWKGEVHEGLPGWSDHDKERVGHEISDIFIYLLDFAERCRIDLPSAVLNKIELNRKKYPISKSYGSSKKYNELD